MLALLHLRRSLSPGLVAKLVVLDADNLSLLWSAVLCPDRRDRDGTLLVLYAAVRSRFRE